MSQPRFEIVGPDAQEIANELHAALQEEFGPTPAPLALTPHHAAMRDATRVDPVLVAAVATLIINVPVAIESTLNLADRFRLKEKWDRILGRVRRRMEGKPGTHVKLIVDPRVLRLEQSKSGDIVELLDEHERTSRQGR